MMKRKKVTFNFGSDDEPEEDSPEENMSSELSSLSEASSGNEWIPPKCMKKKLNERPKRSGIFRPCSSDEDNSDSSSSVIVSHKNKPKLPKYKSKPKLPTSKSEPILLKSALKNNIKEPGRNNAENCSNDKHSLKPLTNDNARVIESNNKQTNESHQQNNITDDPKETPSEPLQKPSERKQNLNLQSYGDVRKFRLGDFLILKTDLGNETVSPLWKIDGKSLLQKYEPFLVDDKVRYKSVLKFVGWCNSTHSSYCHIKVLNIEFKKEYHIVEVADDE